MNTELETLKNELSRMKETYVEKATKYFNDELRKIFEENPKLNEFTVSVNNHEFNDGEATYFSIYADEPRLNGEYSDGFEDKPDDEMCLNKVEAEKISDRIAAVFNLVDDDILEDLYGDAYESLTFERDEIIS